MATLPPGQHRVDAFPRFGTHLHRPPPQMPRDPVIEISGAVAEPFGVSLGDLRRLPRRELIADFHCVAGWSATDLRWEGVAFATLWRTVIEPAVRPDADVTHLRFAGLDGFEAVLQLEDALRDDVLIADRLDGRPLDADHGAPVRLVSPSQYGFMSTKHLCRVEARTAGLEMGRLGAATAIATIGLRSPLAGRHPRARVWEEERHPYLPALPLRPVYRLLTPAIAFLSARGSRSARGDPRAPQTPSDPRRDGGPTHEAPEVRAHLPAVAHPRTHGGLPPRGRVGATREGWAR